MLEVKVDMQDEFYSSPVVRLTHSSRRLKSTLRTARTSMTTQFSTTISTLFIQIVVYPKNMNMIGISVCSSPSPITSPPSSPYVTKRPYFDMRMDEIMMAQWHTRRGDCIELPSAANERAILSSPLNFLLLFRANETWTQRNRRHRKHMANNTLSSHSHNWPPATPPTLSHPDNAKNLKFN